MPFDTCCESMQEKIDECVCSKCGLYWPSKAAKNRHLPSHRVVFDATIDENEMALDEFDSDSEEPPKVENSGPMPVFDSIRNHVHYEKNNLRTVETGEQVPDLLLCPQFFPESS